MPSDHRRSASRRPAARRWSRPDARGRARWCRRTPAVALAGLADAGPAAARASANRPRSRCWRTWPRCPGSAGGAGPSIAPTPASRPSASSRARRRVGPPRQRPGDGRRRPSRRHLRARRSRRARPPGRRRRLRRHLQLVPARRATSWSTSPTSVDVAVLERGPLRARVRIVGPLPLARRGPRASSTRTGEVAHEVLTLLELRAGERAVRVEATIDNRSRDHRLRAHFPLPSPGGRLPGRVRVRDRRAGARRRGRPHRGAAAHLPGPAVRAGGRAHRRARRRGRVRAGRRPRRRGARAGAHAAAVHRDAVAGTDGDPSAARRSA